MSKVSKFLGKTTMNLKVTLDRFPIVLALLLAIAGIISNMIIRAVEPEEFILTRVIFASVFGVFLGIAGQFLCERFDKLNAFEWLMRILTIVSVIVYYFLFTTPDYFSQFTFIRLFVCCFALFALYLYLPSAKGGADFGKIALVHFKSSFTALLYGIVLFLGLLAIYFAMDLLLFDMDEEIIAHIANFVFVFFMPVYYLSLLPKFNSEDIVEVDRNEEATVYPRFLEILVSYILIPLISVFTLVLIAYFLKIIWTRKWPVGQIGPMVLCYSAIGLMLYILCYNLKNKSSSVFRTAFPLALIPLVCLQLVSWYIRVKAYGITESRYYVVLFAVFSIICVCYFIFSKIKNPNRIAIYAAIFAMISIIPPIDAFSISFFSQKTRIEAILKNNDMLSNQQLIAKSNIDNNDKKEITNIINYMERMGYLGQLEWIPDEYIGKNDRYNSKLYEDFDKLFGFEQYYVGNSDQPDIKYVYARLDPSLPIDISGYEAMFRLEIYDTGSEKEKSLNTIKIKGIDYTINQGKDADGSLTLFVTDQLNNTVLTIPMNEVLKQIADKSTGQKELLPASDLTYNMSNEQMRIRIIIDSINFEQTSTGIYSSIYANIYIMITKP